MYSWDTWLKSDPQWQKWVNFPTCSSNYAHVSSNSLASGISTRVKLNQKTMGDYFSPLLVCTHFQKIPRLQIETPYFQGRKNIVFQHGEKERVHNNTEIQRVLDVNHQSFRLVINHNQFTAYPAWQGQRLIWNYSIHSCFSTVESTYSLLFLETAQEQPTTHLRYVLVLGIHLLKWKHASTTINYSYITI